jgi:hypothetical protein
MNHHSEIIVEQLQSRFVLVLGLILRWIDILFIILLVLEKVRCTECTDFATDSILKLDRSSKLEKIGAYCSSTLPHDEKSNLNT